MVRLERLRAVLGEAVLGAGIGLQAGERCFFNDTATTEIDTVAAFELAVELVGAGLAGGDARRQARDHDAARQLVGAVGVTHNAVAIDRALRKAAVQAGLDRVGKALAAEARHPIAAAGVAHGHARPEIVGELAVEAGGEAADIVGDGAGAEALAHRAQSAQRAAPGAPRLLSRIAGDDAGFGQGDPAAAAIATAGLRQQIAHEELGALHHRVGEARVVLAAERGQDARHQRGVDLGERAHDGGVVARGIGRGGIERLPHGILVGRLGDRGKAADLQVEVHVLGVIAQARLQERRRQAGIEPAEGAGHAARGIEDRVARARAISARRREDRDAAAGDRRGPCHRELAALAVGRHVDGEAAARIEGEVAVDRQRAQRCCRARSCRTPPWRAGCRCRERVPSGRP